MHPVGFWTSDQEGPGPRLGKRLAALAMATLMALLVAGPQAVQAADETTRPALTGTAADEVKKGPVLVGFRGLVGREIRNAENETIGNIDDLIVDSQGRVKLVIAVSDGIVDGGKKILADLQDVQRNNGEGLFYDISKKELEREPAYMPRQLP